MDIRVMLFQAAVSLSCRYGRCPSLLRRPMLLVVEIILDPRIYIATVKWCRG